MANARLAYGQAAVALVALLLAGCGSASSRPPQAAAVQVANLNTALTSVSLPPGSEEVSGVGRAHPDPRPLGHDGSSLVTQYWTSPLSMNATLTWITRHRASSWATGGVTRYNLGRTVEWDGPANAEQAGPNVTVTVTANGSSADVELAAWSLPLGHKRDTDTLVGVTAATAEVTNDNGSTIKPFSLRLTAAQARRLADDIDALRVYPPVTWSGLAGTPDVTLTFQTSHGPRRFLASRNGLSVQALDGGDSLFMSSALEHELDVDIPAGRSSSPPSDKHPVLPSQVTAVTAKATWPDAHGSKKPRTTVVRGAAMTTLIADLRPLGQKADAGLCHRKGRPTVLLDVHGQGQDRSFVYYGDCDEVSPLSALDGQVVIPFQSSSALDADLDRLLR